MEVGQNIKFEFISKFKLKFPEISKLIDFEINENGNILTGVKVESNFILNEICFYKKKGISEEKFTKALLVFQTNYNIRPDIVMDCMESKIFEIGDGDDYDAVTFQKVNKKLTAKIWFRWWDETGG